MKGTKMILNLEDINSLQSVMNKIESFEIIENGTIEEIDKDNSKFKKIFENVENLFCSSVLQPAFGVSLHKETSEELKVNHFLKIKFNQPLKVNGLPFENLLIKLEEHSFGVNIIREYKQNYFGRCFYLFLDAEQNLKNLIK